MPSKRRLKVLGLDIETAPIEARVWQLFKTNVGLNQITRDWFILSFCAKWNHKRGVIYHDQSKAPDISDDRALLEILWELLDEADVIVAQNGRRFDVKKINSRFFFYNMPPPSPYKIVDTLEVAKRYFGFTSNKLEWMTQQHCTIKKRPHAKYPGFELWSACLAGDKAAWREMRLYNIDDVRSMMELYHLMLPWITNHPNVGNYVSSDSPVCNRCGSDNIVKNGTYHTDVAQYQKYKCNDCGGHLRGRSLTNTKEQRQRLLTGV